MWGGLLFSPPQLWIQPSLKSAGSFNGGGDSRQSYIYSTTSLGPVGLGVSVHRHSLAPVHIYSSTQWHHHYNGGIVTMGTTSTGDWTQVTTKAHQSTPTSPIPNQGKSFLFVLVWRPPISPCLCVFCYFPCTWLSGWCLFSFINLTYSLALNILLFQVTTVIGHHSFLSLCV